MPRRGFIAKRDVLPDPIYNSKVVTKLVNNIMLDGKKSVAQKIVYDAFDIIKEKDNQEENLEFVSAELKEYITKTLKKLTKLKTEDLLNLRYEKYRKIGKMEE